MDNLAPSRRSWNMSRIKGSNTGPERIVRSILHRMGYRFRLHRKDLPGKPDITLARHKTIVFVHGCFWHRHKGCKDATMPKTRRNFWRNKLKGNTARDKLKQEVLHASGWRVIVWECDTEDIGKLRDCFQRLLGGNPTKLHTGLKRDH